MKNKTLSDPPELDRFTLGSAITWIEYEAIRFRELARDEALSALNDLADFHRERARKHLARVEALKEIVALLRKRMEAL